ncbi:hypothetical protein [Psychrobacter sp. DAB_AL43B]|uniref:hypothetical protein n=1 Tax=Psychrobacter sp. DAB_AL43B TaxID=1028416 RepID=UPI0009A5B0D0|nr:hypothetical protein [Psychrobacter sp. DAB_AL43B]SLJ85284.1 hypothetical protein DABAL43B_2096 [Psychrobacter sp. DAB_AL43B]
MLAFHEKPPLPIIKMAIITTLLIGTAQLLTGCDSQPSSSNNNAAAQTDVTDKGMAKKDETSINPAPINATTTDKTETLEVVNLLDEQTVSPSGYEKLSFGQVITPELLSDLGLTKAEGDNDSCYYVSHPTLSYVDKEYGKRASVLYQVIDNKVALISIQDPNIPFYKGINVGDSATDVMKAHNDALTYEVDKYAVDGDYYSLLANVNFKVIKDSQLGESLTAENIELDNKEDKLPLQIEYHIKGGQKLNDYKIKTTEWTADNKRLLKGEVESIDIGIPAAIYLVEGCS